MLTKRAGEVALPVPSGLTFNVPRATALVGWLHRSSCHLFNSIAMEVDGSETRVHAFPATMDGVRRFNHERAGFNYVVCPPDCHWYIVCSTDDFLVYVGQPYDVEGAAGLGIHAGMQIYRQYEAERQQYSDREARFHRGVLRACESAFAAAGVGARVIVPPLDWADG